MHVEDYWWWKPSTFGLSVIRCCLPSDLMRGNKKEEKKGGGGLVIFSECYLHTKAPKKVVTFCLNRVLAGDNTKRRICNVLFYHLLTCFPFCPLLSEGALNEQFTIEGINLRGQTLWCSNSGRSNKKVMNKIR
ncbi:unnamed protein product [Ilex paraguariensis]|uniref:Uncharacterized protein n=1 Tax=Ilex paraguariensis TaxID=185542 RepID=A0ABC8RBU1_9AQUA